MLHMLRNSWGGSLRPQLLWDRLAYHRIYSTHYLGSTSILHTILSHIHLPPYVTTPYPNSKIHLNVIPNIILGLRSSPFPERFPTQIMYTCLAPPASTMFLLWFHYLNIIMAYPTFTEDYTL
jgi:hypothetical protein